MCETHSPQRWGPSHGCAARGYLRRTTLLQVMLRTDGGCDMSASDGGECGCSVRQALGAAAC